MTTTYTYLKNAEQELRQALKNSVDTAKSYQLKRIAEAINTISDISFSFKDVENDLSSVVDEIKFNGGYDYTPPFMNQTYVFGGESADTISFG
jgi:hypothetical protein